MPSQLSSALAQLDASVRLVQEHLHSLDACLEVSKDQFIRDLSDALQNADAVREFVRAHHPHVDWTDRQGLDKLIDELEGTEARRRKLIELADELSAGTITHRLRSRVTALEISRQAAVQELHAEAAREQPKEIPGPKALAWMQWACGSQENANTARVSELESDFPALVGFVSEMEETYWHPREVTADGSDVRPSAGIGSTPVPTSPSANSPLSEAAPAFAARYGHLSATRSSQGTSAGQASTGAAAVAQAQESQAAAAFTPDSASAPAEGAARPEIPASGNSTAAVEQGPPAVLHSSAQGDEQISAQPNESASEPFSIVEERKNPRFGLNRSLLITLGATAAIVVVLVVISVFSGNMPGKHGESSKTAESASANESSTSPAAPASDLELVGQIEQRLKAIKGGSIYVTVQHGTAILEGQVPSEEALATAEELTLQSSQIKVVRDRLQVATTGALHSTNRPAKASPKNPE